MRLAIICRCVAEFHGVSVAEIRGPSHLRKHVYPRQVAMYLARDLTQCSLTQIGRYFRRDHTTVVHGFHGVQARLARDPTLSERLATLKLMARDAMDSYLSECRDRPLVTVLKGGERDADQFRCDRADQGQRTPAQ
jgi:hypothetical protein